MIQDKREVSPKIEFFRSPTCDQFGTRRAGWPLRENKYSRTEVQGVTQGAEYVPGQWDQNKLRQFKLLNRSFQLTLFI